MTAGPHVRRAGERALGSRGFGWPNGQWIMLLLWRSVALLDKEVAPMKIRSSTHAPALSKIAVIAAGVLGMSLAAAQQPASEASDAARRAGDAAEQAGDAAERATRSARQATGDESPSFLAEQVAQATATVTKIDAEKRLLSLRAEDGREFTVEADEEVRNFSQIEVGDTVDVRYYQSLAADLTDAPPSDSADAVLVGSRAQEGQRPGGSVGLVYTAIVTIDSVDPETHTVTFTGPEGTPRETTVQRPDARDFVSQLKPGDRVQITYGEALAIAVAPTGERRLE
jgi:hypothetical protein